MGEYQYMLMSRMEMDLKFYINTKAEYCGNCTDSHLFFGNIEDHVTGSLKHHQALPVEPVWLPKRKLHRLCSKAMKLASK